MNGAAGASFRQGYREAAQGARIRRRIHTAALAAGGRWIMTGDLGLWWFQGAGCNSATYCRVCLTGARQQLKAYSVRHPRESGAAYLEIRRLRAMRKYGSK